jgi:hypothetical protein
VKVPNADTWESSDADWLFNWFCWPAPKALVRDDTIALILSPEPMPLDVISEVAALLVEFAVADEDVAAVAVGVVELEMVELMAMRSRLNYRCIGTSPQD